MHFVADILFAVPLLLAPEVTLRCFGWQVVDPAATRLVAAALFGIGIQSLLGRNEGAETFRAMLNLKVIWSGAAVVGLLWTQLEGGPSLGWLAFAIFAVFNGVWVRYRILLALKPNEGSSQLSPDGGAPDSRSIRALGVSWSTSVAPIAAITGTLS